MCPNIAEATTNVEAGVGNEMEKKQLLSQWFK